ncbi:MAG: cupin-like domain-containing protein, partial [Caulobacteraceae bacterium]|nr:cupin-like domain-containing protein [Caulobacter sp.]
PELFASEIESGFAPVVMRGFASDWPAVAAARSGVEAVADYLKRFGGERTARVMVAPAIAAGRFFYKPDFSGLNFERTEMPLTSLVDTLLARRGQAEGPAIYAGAQTAADGFPGWTEENRSPVDLTGSTARIWVGNATRVSAHFDMSANVAVVVAGRRRFTLFPPEQATNLYMGPVDAMVAGQPVSMVDIEAPDLTRFPRFEAAMAERRIVDLAPGDAIFIPPMWWHEVRASGDLNVLVNYWSDSSALSPFTALVHSLAAVRDLPAPQRAAMKAWFDHYVFADDAAHAADHLPPARRGVLGPAGPQRDLRARNYVLHMVSGR